MKVESRHDLGREEEGRVIMGAKDLLLGAADDGRELVQVSEHNELFATERHGVAHHTAQECVD